MINEATMVNSLEFWALMCDPKFIRISPLCGQMCGEVFITLEAPEDIPGFIDQQIAGVKTIFRH